MGDVVDRTRTSWLHARYGKDLKDDLVFRAVEPIVGGRGVPDANGALDTGVTTTGSSNFQGRGRRDLGGLGRSLPLNLV